MEVNTTQYAEKISIDEYNRQKDEYTQKALKELQGQMKQQEYKKRSLPDKRTNCNDYNKDNRRIELDVDDTTHNDTTEEFIDNPDSDDSDNDDGSFYDGDNKEYNQSVNFIIKHSIETMKNDKGTGSVTKTTKEPIKEKKKCDIKRKSPIRANEHSSSANAGITSAVLAQHEYDNKVINNLKQVNKSLRDEIEDLDKKLHYMKLDMNNLQVENNDLKESLTIMKNNYDKQSKQLSDIKDTVHGNTIYIITLKLLVALLIFIIAILLILYRFDIDLISI